MAAPNELEARAWSALDAVMDPELDEPITDLGFVRSLSASDQGDLLVHLRLPTSFCSPNFAYLMASDTKDVLGGLAGVGSVVVELDDHHDSDLINAGLAADAGYQGTFGPEAEESLDELRLTFRKKAHTAAMERALTAALKASPGLELNATLADLPASPATEALKRRRHDLGLSLQPDAPVLVNEDGTPVPREQAEFRLRRARSTRISIDGNAHFCRGLLRTRYPGSDADQNPCAHGDTDGRPLLSLEVKAS
ncbi:metal-sulfur cluster assembly factor [Kineosporia babensis]|uniref:Iron-sulfur cluster assembly protein n=1 Tax=Kineosporia babensis TaxID=499548 RepID=A0A9X1NMN5_9ACTN|nr:iron-sulfur cluster assembly protein [Kineosporia babensis]MCD5316546.1 iron-sulfur cluster assembly protein [Kineosporia babensis]